MGRGERDLYTLRYNVSLRNDSLEDKGIIEEIGVTSEDYRMTMLHRDRRLFFTNLLSRKVSTHGYLKNSR